MVLWWQDKGPFIVDSANRRRFLGGQWQAAEADRFDGRWAGGLAWVLYFPL